MAQTLIGYDSCATDNHDFSVRHDALPRPGESGNGIYKDTGLTGTNRIRPGLDRAMAAVRHGDTLVVPTRSIESCDPCPMGKPFFNILATFSEFELDPIRPRIRDGMGAARAKGRPTSTRRAGIASGQLGIERCAKAVRLPRRRSLAFQKISVEAIC